MFEKIKAKIKQQINKQQENKKENKQEENKENKNKENKNKENKNKENKNKENKKQINKKQNREKYNQEKNNYYNNFSEEINIKFPLFSKRKTKKVISLLQEKNVKWLLFYTDIHNVMYNIEHGIKIVDNIDLKKGQNYIVWSFSQLHNQINLDLSISGRTIFWDWIVKEKINIKDVAVIAIDINKLFLNTKINWKYDENNKMIYIYEDIKPETFKWIMVKNYQIKEKIAIYSKHSLPNLSIFYGDEYIQKGRKDNETIKKDKK